MSCTVVMCGTDAWPCKIACGEALIRDGIDAVEGYDPRQGCGFYGEDVRCMARKI